MWAGWWWLPPGWSTWTASWCWTAPPLPRRCWSGMAAAAWGLPGTGSGAQSGRSAPLYGAAPSPWSRRAALAPMSARNLGCSWNETAGQTRLDWFCTAAGSDPVRPGELSTFRKPGMSPNPLSLDLEPFTSSGTLHGFWNLSLVVETCTGSGTSHWFLCLSLVLTGSGVSHWLCYHSLVLAQWKCSFRLYQVYN